MNFIEELTWRGMVHTTTPDIETVFDKPVSAYIGFDPTSSSLHIGSLATIMLLMHLQRHGHFPIVLIGGATGMIGDPSGKNSERAFLSGLDIRSNAVSIKNQLSKFMDFDGDKAVVINNLQWFGEMSVIQFLREAGKLITVNSMLAKDSVKSRIENGISFTEFSYQLLQGFDFYTLYKDWDVTVQLGGSDQWGNMTAGIELIRKKEGVKVHALTMPLVTKEDGSKFGKSESGNIWLDRNLTSPFHFYQYWINVSDSECVKMLSIFTFLSKEEIDELAESHAKVPHLRLMQKRLAEDVTTRVHSAEDTNLCAKVSQLLYGKIDLQTVTKQMWEVVETVIPTFRVNELSTLTIATFLVDSNMVSSKSDFKRVCQQKGIKLNGKVLVEGEVLSDALLGKYYFLQKGKMLQLFVII